MNITLRAIVSVIIFALRHIYSQIIWL